MKRTRRSDRRRARQRREFWANVGVACAWTAIGLAGFAMLGVFMLGAALNLAGCGEEFVRCTF